MHLRRRYGLMLIKDNTDRNKITEKLYNNQNEPSLQSAEIYRYFAKRTINQY